MSGLRAHTGPAERVVGAEDRRAADGQRVCSRYAWAEMATRRKSAKQRDADRAPVLNALMRIAVSRLELSEVFDQVAEQVRRLVPFDRMVLLRRLPGANEVEVYAGAGDPPPELERPRMPLDNTPWGESMATGQPLIANATDDSPWPIMRELREESGYRCVMQVPLRAEGGTFGALALASYEFDTFTEQDVQSAQEIADHLAVVMELAFLHVQEREATRREERARLARDLHDTLGQSLASIAIQLEAAEDLPAAAADEVRAVITTVRQQARESLEEARRTVWEPRPTALANADLASALRSEAARLDRAGTTVSITVAGAAPTSLPERIEITLFRIAQEAMNNISKHARAKATQIQLEYEPSAVRLRVSDDGVGFDPEALSETLGGRGFGLSSMQERARLVGGRIDVRSRVGLGTEIDVVLPVQADDDPVPALAHASIHANRPADRPDAIRVLVVDDHEVVRTGIRAMLDRSAGTTVVGEAGDGESALAQIAELEPDVTLLDVAMPGLDGVRTLQELRRRGLTARVILLSVFAKEEQIFDGIRSGARGYLVKDTGREDLIQAIRTVHGGGSLLPPVIAERLADRLDQGSRDDLTDREREILQHLASGATNKEIARAVSLSPGTVKWHIANVFQKLGASTRTEAVRVAQERGLTPGS